HYQDLARYNRWMNDRLYTVCAALPDDERKRDRGAFFHSIHGSLNHLLLTDRAWLGRLTRDPRQAESLDAEDRPIPFSGRLDQELYADFDHLRRERERADMAIETWVAGLDSEQLATPVRYRTTAGVPYEHPLWWAVSHLFNHQTHHRGQVTTILSQLGRD